VFLIEDEEMSALVASKGLAKRTQRKKPVFPRGLSEVYYENIYIPVQAPMLKGIVQENDLSVRVFFYELLAGEIAVFAHKGGKVRIPKFDLNGFIPKESGGVGQV
jgi:hypothetical protein